MEQNFPNPFNPVTTIKYTVPGRFSSSALYDVNLSVYNIRGQLVRSLVGESKRAGKFAVVWNGKANNGRLVASGVYFYRIDVAKRYTLTRKMVVVK